MTLFARFDHWEPAHLFRRFLAHWFERLTTGNAM